MASSYSTDLKLELMVTGENAGTWGDNTNNNLNLIQQAIAGYEAIALTDGGTVTLAMTDKTISNARNMVIKFTGTLTTASTVTIPDSIEKFYIIDLSAVVGVTNLTIKTVSGTGFTAGEAKIVAAYSDGTNLNEIALDTLGGTIGTAQIADNAITAAKISNNAVTTNKILASNVTTNKLAASAVTANNIANSTITQAKLASDSVGPDQLISTGVTAGSYTATSITVDADGRITAASSGSGGALNMIHKVTYETGGATGTFTANPAANVLDVYIMGGGGGARSTTSAVGGRGGMGYFRVPITQPYSVPYVVGNAGSGIYPYPAANGNASSLNSTDAVANGGTNSGNGPPTGASNGSAPGATSDWSAPNSAPTAYYGSSIGRTWTVPMNPINKGMGANGGTGDVFSGSGSGQTGAIVIFENIGS